VYPPPDRPPEITWYAPANDRPAVRAGGRLDFAMDARDPEGAPLTFAFTVDDSLVSDRNRLTFRPTVPGTRRVRASVFDGRHTVARGWEVSVGAAPDTIAPAAVEITRFDATDAPGEAELAWLAVGDDGNAGTPSHYAVRTAPAAVLTEDDWSRADAHPRVTSPALAGEPVHITMTGLPTGRTVYVSVRAVDEEANRSPISGEAHSRLRGFDLAGRVADALTGAGIADASVALGSRETSTGPAGEYALLDLAGGAVALRARDEGGGAVGAYYDYLLPFELGRHDVVDLVLLPNAGLETVRYTDFLQFFRAMTDVAGNQFATRTRRWELPIDLHVPPFSRAGLDYRAAVHGVAGEFDAILGRPVFRLVDASPATGVAVEFRDDIGRDNYQVTRWTADEYPEQGRVEFRTVYAPASRDAFEVVARHELGHALGLNHSTDTLHLMVGGPAPAVSRFSPDEIAVLRCFYGIPRGWDNALYDAN
jgi:hypothetical protein